jgi:hypothetical protein
LKVGVRFLYFGKMLLEVLTVEKWDCMVSWMVSRSCKESVARLTVSSSFKRRLKWKSFDSG